MITYLGSLTLGAAIPIGVQAQAALQASINTQLPELQARLTAALAAQAQLTVSPPGFTAVANAAAALVAALSAAGTLPALGLQLTVVADVLAGLELMVGALEAQLAFAASLGILFGAPGVHAIAYTGIAGQLGPELTSFLSSGFPSDGNANTPTNAILLATTLSSTWTAMQSVLRTA